MREAVKRARWLAVTLFSVCVAALSHPTPSALPGAGDEPGVVLQGGTLVSAIPAPTAPTVVPSVDSPSMRDRRIPVAPAFQDPALPDRGIPRPPHPEQPAPREDRFLMGLRALPANAPPLL